MKTKICFFSITVVFMLSLAVTSSAEKLFWVDCGPEFDCTNAKLYYVDSSSVTPKAVLFVNGVFVYAYGDTSVGGEIPSIDYSFLTGNLDPLTYQVTNIKTDYIFYFKNGSIWLVDTETLAKRRLSNESGITPSTFCSAEAYDADLINPNNRAIKYHLKGPDEQCDTGDDIRCAVKVGMTSTTPPINMPNKSIQNIAFDGRYIVKDDSSKEVQICSTDLNSCKQIIPFTDSVDFENFNLQWVILIVDCKLISYDYISETLYTLYTPPPGECVDTDGLLHKDGYVYFQTKRDTSPFTNAIKKVPVNGGSVQSLTEFTTDKELDSFDLDISPTHVVYSWKTSKYSEEHVRSIPKGGGTPVVINDTCVNGIKAGQYYFCEDKNGNVWRVKLDGTQRIKRASSQLNGSTYGCSADWFYGIIPSVGRVFLSDMSNNLKSYAINEDFRNPTKGISIGTVPVNLSNFNTFSEFGFDMLGFAMKRSTVLSFGTDMLLLDATTPSSLKRLTNTNRWKIIYTSD
ncbi:MAG: hypothetical protein ABIB41_02190 [Nitrospirota bacterium]